MEFQNYRRWILIAIGVLLSSPSPAADIRLTNGQVYKNATVVSKDATDLQIQLGYQKLRLPIQTVESIDGVLIRAIPSPRSTPLHPASPTPTPLLAPPLPLAVATSATPPPISKAKPTPTPSTVQPTESAWPPYTHRWNMDLVLLLFAGVSVTWLGTIAKVQRDLFERRVDPRFWTNTTILLPGLGFGLYFVTRGITSLFKYKKTETKAPSNLNETIAEREKATTAGHNRQGFEFLDEDRKSILLKNPGTVSGIDSAQEVLEEALLGRASDIHIEPSDLEYRVRFRIDGVMHSRMTFERNGGQKIVSAIKTLAQIDVAEKRKSQDGRFRVRKGDMEVDFRVATANSIFGEKLVIRILNRKMGLLSLSELGMPQEMMEQFQRVIQSRNGMILATGPTGSGKTSTLYSALSQLDAKRMNVVTIEDPVEYELEGATQMLVNEKAGVTYESGLRSLLRQDPDVIFIGEMRDLEPAQIALRAALTGHLLFSSLHTKDAIGTIIRLEEMGIERTQLASALLVVISQRLVRVLCPVCREAYTTTGEELRDIGLELPVGATIYKATGCPECRDTGYLGRTGIFEMIVFDDDLRQAVTDGVGEHALTELARTKGYRGHREEGATKLLLGVTSVDEILQAI